MQFSFNFSASNPLPYFPFSWKSHKTNFLTPSLDEPIIPIKPSLKPLTLSNSLKTSLNCEFQRGNLDEPTSPASLPVVILGSGSVSRYIWDGSELKLVSGDGNNAVSLKSLLFSDFEDGFGKLFRMCSLGVRNFFLPRQVTGNYFEYVKWKLLHRVFSSALQVLATQAMFRAIGVGYSRSLPSAAALNWVLKDGLGRLSRCIYTASLASAFDTNLKRVRFSTSVLFSLSIGIELLTPAYPQYFLLLATIANIAKQISLACYLATGTAVHRSFAVADNLGEVSAKAQIQTVCFDNLGLMLAAALNILFRNNQRLEIIITKWVELGCVPSPADVSKVEGVNFMKNNGRGLWPIRIGCLNPKRQIPRLSMTTMQSLKGEDMYFVCLEIICSRLAATRQVSQGIVLCVREGSCTADVVMGLLQACHIRKAMLSGRCRWEDNLGACYDSSSVLRHWFELVEDSKQCAHRDFTLLNDRMLEVGWACKNILLSTEEQARYSFLHEEDARR
ncbi:protein root UVB sensitive 4 isoform X4 [Rhododendron vialii]|uniref:protein root UVB sensitive 4 isoform X4 n=1 Tax=Rhododendron vialii TaxID=182163 RepID=UPI00265D628A|nr:protein root UVB sensitive 4 isoform X4 [Rhododendron vialii]